MRSQTIVETPEDYDAWLQSQIASKEAGENTVAMVPETLSTADRLALRTANLGVDDRTLAQLHPMGHHH